MTKIRAGLIKEAKQLIIAKQNPYKFYILNRKILKLNKVENLQNQLASSGEDNKQKYHSHRSKKVVGCSD